MFPTDDDAPARFERQNSDHPAFAGQARYIARIEFSKDFGPFDEFRTTRFNFGALLKHNGVFLLKI